MTAATVADLPKLEYRPLLASPGGAFSCGVPEIDKWFKRCEPKHRQFLSRVTTVHIEESTDIVAFYALSMKLENERMLAPDEKKSWSALFQKRENLFICLNFDYLAVSKKQQGKGIGTIVMGKVIADFATIASHCGVELMTGSAIDKKTFKFYQKLGFQQYGFADNRPQIFLPALSAIEMVGG